MCTGFLKEFPFTFGELMAFIFFPLQHRGGKSSLTSCIPHLPFSPERLGRQHRACAWHGGQRCPLPGSRFLLCLVACEHREAFSSVCRAGRQVCFLGSWGGGPVPFTTGFGLGEGCQSGRRETLGRRPSKDQMVTGRKKRQEKYFQRGI